MSTSENVPFKEQPMRYSEKEIASAARGACMRFGDGLMVKIQKQVGKNLSWTTYSG